MRALYIRAAIPCARGGGCLPREVERRVRPEPVHLALVPSALAVCGGEGSSTPIPS